MGRDGFWYAESLLHLVVFTATRKGCVRVQVSLLLLSFLLLALRKCMGLSHGFSSLWSTIQTTANTPWPIIVGGRGFI